jgi:hypothetical protein
VESKRPEYVEGDKALENFEQMATTVFKAPKADGRKNPKKASAQPSERKPKRADKD